MTQQQDKNNGAVGQSDSTGLVITDSYGNEMEVHDHFDYIVNGEKEAEGVLISSGENAEVCLSNGERDKAKFILGFGGHGFIRTRKW